MNESQALFHLDDVRQSLNAILHPFRPAILRANNVFEFLVLLGMKQLALNEVLICSRGRY
jgi:hypothetical protein